MTEAIKTIEIQERKKANSKKSIIMLIVGIIIIVMIVAFLIFTIFVSPRGGDWYAVFLTNGRSYFGHVIKQSSQTLVLKDVYYLQVQQVSAEEREEVQPQISLVNVSDEIHQPESELQISRQQILFIQKLKSDSQVVLSIEQQPKK
ncbi:MAG: hypothetical protein PHG59_00485 [Patescibacteria group bacterium]|nr:hypothetical protein [Patescibacteria group bacterium]